MIIVLLFAAVSGGALTAMMAAMSDFGLLGCLAAYSLGGMASVVLATVAAMNSHRQEYS